MFSGMTEAEARIARIALRLGVEADIEARDPAFLRRLSEMFIITYRPEKPCRYAVDCVLYGRCPFDPCCNN